MHRIIYPLLVMVLAAAAVPAIAQTCTLTMEVSCVPGTNGAVCTSVTTNRGGDCHGAFYSGWFASTDDISTTIASQQNSMPMSCTSNGYPGVLECGVESATLKAGAKLTSKVTVGGRGDVPLVAFTSVGALLNGAERGSTSAFVNARIASCAPSISAPPVTQAGVGYTVSWTAVSDPTAQFVIEESSTDDFDADLTSTQMSGLSKTFLHDNLSTPTTWYYRVRPTHCTGGTATSSETIETVVQIPAVRSPKNADIVVPAGSTDPVFFAVKVPPPPVVGGSNHVTYTTSTDQPFLTVTPKSGVLTQAGLTMTVTARPESLSAGANDGTVLIAYQSPAGNGTIAVPVSLSLATPVRPGRKANPWTSSLLIPVVTHVNGISSPFLSDVRVTNAGNTPLTYQLTMTSTKSDTTGNKVTSSKVTNVPVEAQATVAFNDIVSNFFGFGATTDPADFGFGSLEIRPLNGSGALSFASSRTYANTAGGTFGQYIAPVPFDRFARRANLLPGDDPSTVLSLQHVSQSTAFRTNLGLAEGAGQPAAVRVRFFNRLGALLKEVPIELAAGEMRQDNIGQWPYSVTNLEDGRIEVVLTSIFGAVTAYASVVDNRTNDPLAVMPVSPAHISATRFVVPGIAELPPPARQNFHSDIRLFNGGSNDVQVTPTFYPQGNGTPKSAPARTVRAGETLVINNVLPSLFNVTNGGGSVVFTTSVPASLVATGRTFTSVAGGGSFGQFIPGVTPSEGAGLGGRPLQLLQLEQSDRFRSNIGLAELTGNPVTVRLRMFLADGRTEVREETLAANQFLQIQPLPARSYNARISVEVISGAGRVTAYGSVIDNESLDPTYVPAQ